MYVVTETLHFANPDMRSWDIEPNTVAKICETEEEAIAFVNERIKLPLYKPFSRSLKRIGNKFVVYEPDFAECTFTIHKHEF